MRDMKANLEFVSLNKEFWANIRSITQIVGYTEKGTKRVYKPTIDNISEALERENLSAGHLVNPDGVLTQLGEKVIQYFNFRADIINNFVEKSLMDEEEAGELYKSLVKKYKPIWTTPWNKQKGDKKNPAYFTGIVNTLLEYNLQGLPIDYNPRKLTTITKDKVPIRTFARWMDGAFPSTVNPIAVWEIKEYYYATTFGSRVADALYETQLDGFEIEELKLNEDRHILHYLMIDSHRTFWEKGRPYLCRIIDLLHMGFVDEVLFGKEVIDRIPIIAEDWKARFSN